MAAYLTVLVDYDRVIVSSSGFATTPGMVGTALQYLRQTRARLARLQEHYPDYARQLDASLDRYEQLLEQRASHPEAIDDATGLGAEIGSAAAGLKAVADGASRLVEECPGG